MVFSLLFRRRHQPPALDTSVFDQVLAEGDVEKCRKLAGQLIDFIDREDTTDAERALVMPYITRLASHRQMAVREFTAEKALACQRLDAATAFTIIAGEDAIALPFIVRAACLNDASLQLAVFRAGDMYRRKAVCARPDIAREVVSEVVETADRSLLLACLENPSATLTPAQARQLYVRHRDDEEVIEALMQRSDLPLEVRIAHVEIMSGRRQQVMARKDWQAASRAADAAPSDEERALADILADASTEQELQTALDYLARRGKLTASVLLRAASVGHVAVLIHALAWLARMRPSRIRSALRPGSSLAVVRTALARSGLPQGTHALALAVLLAARTDAWEEVGQIGRRLPAFAPRVLETIAETDMLSVTEKMEAASMLQRLADEQTRELAAHFVQTLLRHAA